MGKHIFIRGNSKLGKDVLILNLPPKKTCPGATEWCKQNCYAMKGLHLFPNVARANADSYERTLREDFVENAIAELRRSSKPYVRLLSSGDIYNAAFARKLTAICKATPDKKFLAFTKSVHLIEDLKVLARLPNVSLYESLDETKPTPKTHFLRAMVTDKPDNNIIRKRTRETIRCPGECGPCGYKCWDGDKHVIFNKH